LLPSVQSTPHANALVVHADPRLLRRVLATICAQFGRDTALDGVAPLSLQLETVQLISPLVEPHGEIAAGRWVVVRCRRDVGGVSDQVLASLMAPDYASRHPQRDTGVDLPVALARMQRMGGHLSARRIGADGSEVLLWLRPVTAASTSVDASETGGDASVDEPPAQPRTRRTPWMASEALTAAGDAAGGAALRGPPTVVANGDVQGLRVLLVDDDPLVLRTAERLLQRVGCVVTTATGGDEAATLLDAGTPAIDLIVTDVVMPGLSGPALVARLRARGDGRPVVYMSGYTGDAFSAAAELDEDAILVAKPFTTAMLVSAIREALGATGGGR
jgi:two-component system cell cycle sensor histidine kinase/response regulator CckA